MNRTRGYLTIAQGKQRYIKMAINLARSIRMNSPGEKIAVVSDRNPDELKPWFDIVIPVNENHGVGLKQKLYLNEYSPFDECIFIDADCLAVRNISFLWDLFKGHSFSAIGTMLQSGEWAGMKIPETLKNLNIDYVIQLNGGVYYMEKDEKSNSICKKAQDLISDYDQLGIARLRNQINEEPLISLAMSIFKEKPLDDEGKGMRTPVGQSGRFKMDILRDDCTFFKHGILVEPAIMHFGGGYPEAFHYRREIKKMNLHQNWKLPRSVSSFLVNLTWNPIYASYVFMYRVFKFIFKRKKFRFTPLLPMFKFE